MVKTLLLLAVVIFAVSGICEFIYSLKMLLHFPGKRFKSYTFVTLENGYAVRQLEFLWQKIRWQGDSFSNGIIAACDTLETSEILSCKEYIKNKNIVLCAQNEISEYLELQGVYFND